jgi:hypothetical protein
MSSIFADTIAMDIQKMSMDMAQNRVQEEAAIRVQAMMLETIKETGADLAKLMESAEAVTDPAKGNYLNLFM